MREIANRRAVLQFLSTKRERDGLLQLASLGPPAISELLRWLDQSGLALYFAQRASDSKTLDVLPLSLRSELERRVVANQIRTVDMMREFSRINLALRTAGADYAVLKGFTLAPEFCGEPRLRHQTDIDLLVAPDSMSAVRLSISALGYLQEGEELSGELRFGIPSMHIPSAGDFLYDIQRHRQVELHRHFYESVNGVSLQPHEDWTRHVEPKTLEGVEFPALDLPYRILGQLLHGFRHILHGWLRLGWLFEIGQVIENFRSDTTLWNGVEELMSGDSRVREACGVVLAMTSMAFGIQLPEFIERRWIATLRKPLILWVENFGMGWMLSDFPGSRFSLLLHREFADSPVAWQRFRLSRSKRRLRAITIAKLASPGFLAGRIREQAEYYWHYLNWNIQLVRHSLDREGTVSQTSR
jgi:hypothetical protein